MGSTGTSMRTQKREHVKYRKTLCAQSNCLGSAEILKQTKSNHIVRWPRSCENTKRQTGGRWRTTPHTEGSPWLFRNRYFVPLPGNNRCGHSLNLTLEAGSSPGRHCLGWRLLMEFRQTWGGKRRQRSEGWLSKWWFPSWQTGKKKDLYQKLMLGFIFWIQFCVTCHPTPVWWKGPGLFDVGLTWCDPLCNYPEVTVHSWSTTPSPHGRH